ncbi:hypothetical protein ACM66B_000620 [Microbotryomycetes sp. NB124-2]
MSRQKVSINNLICSNLFARASLPVRLRPEHQGSSQAATSSVAFGVPARSVAVCGPIHHSSLLHLAINHVNGHSKASGPASNPEQAQPKRQVLIFTPSEASLRRSIVQEHDTSIVGINTDSHKSMALSRITIKELPTVAHLKYFLATMYTSDKHGQARKAYDDIGGAAKADPSWLEHEPSLVVLHNASDYILQDAEQSGVDAFASILALFTTACQSAFSRPPLLVLHDSQVFSIDMPVVSPRIARTARARRSTRDSYDDGDDEADSFALDKINLGDVLPLFFDWTARAEPRTSQARQQGQNAEAADSRQWFVIKFAPSRRRLVDGACKPFDLTYIVAENEAAEIDEEGVQVQPLG